MILCLLQPGKGIYELETQTISALTASFLLFGNSAIMTTAEGYGVYVDGEEVAPTTEDSKTYDVGDVTAVKEDGVEIIASGDNSLTVTTGSVSSPLNGVLVNANSAEVNTEINGDINAGSAGISIAARDEAVVNTAVEGDISAEKGSGIMVLAENSDVTTTVTGDVSGEGVLVPAAITAVSLSGDSSIETYVDGNVTSETGAGILTGASGSSEETAPSSQTADDLKAGAGKSLTEVNGDVSGGAAGIVSLIGGSSSEVIITGTLGATGSSESALLPDEEHAPVVLMGEDAGNMELTVWKIERDGKDIGEDDVIAADYDSSTQSLTQNKEFERNIQYIIKVEQPEGATLTPTDSTGVALGKKHSEILGQDLDWAHAEDTVLLEVKLEPGYVLRGAYNGDGEKVSKTELVKDANGKYFIKVPRGGGVYLSVVLEKEASESKSSGGAAAAPVVDNVVTCQMAGYPDNYAWNEAAKACQPGFLDDAGVFHPETTAVRKANIPATADMGLQVYTWILMGSMVIAMLCAVRLCQGELES